MTALTGASKDQRDQGFAETFLSLGHLAHVVQDATVPAHARNEPHPPICGRADGYEKWVDATRRTDQPLFSSLLGATPVRPSAVIFATGTGDPQAPVPIARLIDSRLFLGSGVAALNSPSLLGVAEYTNGNFLSGHTRFRRFGLPRQPNPQDVVFEAEGPEIARYFSKGADGESIQHFVREGMLYDSLAAAQAAPVPSGGWVLDRRVHRDYAGTLLPRAVGYSAALLDYFFRGKLEATIEADPEDPQSLQLSAKNASAEPLDRGTLAVYGDYAGGERRQLGSWSVPGTVIPGGDLPRQGFSPGDPVPARYMVVYQGDLGEEKKDSPPGFGGAVIGRTAKYGGVIEELILFRASNNRYDVYFRNQFQIALLGLSESLPVAGPSGNGVFPAEVHWGVDSNHFFVKNYEIRTVANSSVGVPVYNIYRIDRADNSVSGDEPVRAQLVKTIRPPATLLPYEYHENWINLPEFNQRGQVVYPYGMVYTDPRAGLQAALSQQEVLSEDLGNGRGLEIYALFQAGVYEEIEYVERGGGDGFGEMAVSLIMQASTGAIVYEDPISGPYKAQVAAAVSRGNHAVADFRAWPQTWIVSWSDKDVTKRRWVTRMQVDDSYVTYDWNPEEGRSNTAYHFVENSVQTVLIENGQPKSYITPKQTYVAYSPFEGQDPVAIFYAAALVPTMSSRDWLWIDEPDSFQSHPIEEKWDSDILRRTQYLMSAETGGKQRVGEWTPLEDTQYVVAPKIREMAMLQPGFLYAHGEPVYAIPQLSGYDVSVAPLAQDLTADTEKQKFVSFLGPDGQVNPAFTTSAPLLEDADLRGKGTVRTDNLPAEFQAVLDTLLNPQAGTHISWHVVPDADLVPAQRR